MDFEKLVSALRTYINDNYPGLLPTDDELVAQNLSLSAWLHEHSDTHTGRINALLEALNGLEDAIWMED